MIQQNNISNSEQKWYEDDEDNDEVYSFKEYDISSTPNDFNTMTIISFIESGLFKIPGFQRNYIWDIKRASKLIESLIIGLPIPQVFLYEESKDKYLVIDGQQRLLTIYFFKKKRFPKIEKRFELRQIFDDNGIFPDNVLHDNNYFEDFTLKLNGEENKLDGLNYLTLGEFKNNFDLRTVRNIMIKQNFPNDDDSAMFEIFNRLNSGGVVLKPQEIRTSLYHSKFYNFLYKMNLNTDWRSLLNKKEPDIHMKDVEILLRGFAMLLNNDTYNPSMTRFLNQFSKDSKRFNDESLIYFEHLFKIFCSSAIELSHEIFISKFGKFSITIFESIFVALCSEAAKNNNLTVKRTSIDLINSLKINDSFIRASQYSTTSKKNVKNRLDIAKETIIVN